MNKVTIISYNQFIVVNYKVVDLHMSIFIRTYNVRRTLYVVHQRCRYN